MPYPLPVFHFSVVWGGTQSTFSEVTGLNIEVVRVDAEKGLLFVRGGVPGHPDALLQVRPSVKVRA